LEIPVPRVLNLPAAFVFSVTVLVAPALAQDTQTISLTLKDAQFTPAEIKVPAGQDFVLEFSNENAKPAELESADLQIEKIAPPNSKVTVRVKALEAGSYAFVDEFQEDVAKGVIVAE
jgi:plastocyanin domain-containing protein